MVEVRCSETCKSQQHNILTPSSPMKNLSEKLDMTPTLRSFYSYNGNLSALFGFTGKQRPQYEISLKTQASLKETNNNSPPSGSIQAPNGKGQENSSKINKPQASSKNNHENLPSGDVTLAFSKETCEKSPAADGKCCVGTRNEQTSNDEFPLKRQNIMEEKEEKSELKSIRLTLVDCSVTCVPVYNGQIHADQRSMRSLENVTSFVHFTAKDSNKTFGQQANNYHGVQRLVGDVHPEDSILSTSAIKLNGKYGLQKSTYRGVTRHKWTGKFEAHLWDGSCSTEGRTRKGKQVYLGGYETAEEAARAHDLTVLKYWGPSASAKLNFHISNYEKELEEMESMSREELVTFLRRQSLSFTRGTSIYRGVTSRNREGHWQARIKVASSKKDIYLGTFSSEEEAAKAYDIAAIHLKGINALTNFDVSNYLQGDLKESECFPKPKRVRRIGKFSSLNSDSEIDPCSDENIPQSDSPLDEIVRRKISALLPDHPTAVMPRLRDEHILL